MRIFAALLCILIFDFSYGRGFAAIRKDAFIVGVSRADSASEYDFIAEITAKMKISRFRLTTFDNASDGEKLLLSGKIDAIISKINYSPHLESKFLLSEHYHKNEIVLAVSISNNNIWTLSDFNGKKLAFIPKDISSEQVLAIWPNAKLSAARGLNEALNFLQHGEAEAIIASRQTLRQANSSLRIFPNKLAENNIVALFAPESKTLQEEFNKSLRIENEKLKIENEPEKINRNPNNIDKIINLLNELKKEIEILQKELK